MGDDGEKKRTSTHKKKKKKKKKERTATFIFSFTIIDHANKKIPENIVHSGINNTTVVRAQ